MSRYLHVKYFIALFLFAWYSVYNANAQTLIGLTQPHLIGLSQQPQASFIYLDKSGNLKGKYVKLVQKAFDKINVKVKINADIWPEHMEKVKKNENYFIFPIAKTAEREKSFKFSSIPLYESRTFLYARKTSYIKIKSIADARNQKICILKNDNRVNFINKENFTKIIKIAEPDLLIKALDNRQCDLVISSLLIENYWVKKNEFTPLAKKVFEIESLKTWRYVAFNKNVNDEIVKKFNIALKQLLKDKDDVF